ncbi:MAG: replication-relaxation family protein [Actinobacteria bacterium]|nr:replication-relaxation family protein [Actinomycetota bacterium]
MASMPTDPPADALLLGEVHAGVELLVSHTIEFDVRDGTRPRLSPTDRDLDILEALCELRYLTTAMLAVLAWGRYNTRLRERLRLLFRAGLVRRFRPPSPPSGGRHQWIYELDVKGHRVLRDRREGTVEHWAPSELYSLSYAEHDLELNALLCEIGARAAAHVGQDGPLWRAAPFRVQGPRSGRVDPDREARPAADADPRSELPPGSFVDPGSSVGGVIEPDATLTGTHAVTGEPIAVLIEYDRTRRATKLVGKLARYDNFLARGWRRTRHATMPDEPGVLFVTRDEQHVGNVLREADRHLTASIVHHGERRRRHFPGREEIAVTSRGRLLDGDDTIVQVTPDPAARASAVEEQLSLVRLFAARRDR